MRVGVFVCHCGRNIAGTLNIEKIKEEVAKHSGVVHVEDYIFMCSDPGQKLIRDRIKEKNLDAVVVSACSPSLHEKTFRNNAASVGLNPYKVEIANIREWASWPHEGKPEEATEKAIKIIKATVEKAKSNIPLEPISVPVTRKVLVIGGGIAGIQASLDIANAGLEVYLVEKKPSIGGKMAQFSETFPTLDCPQCIETPKMTEVANHPNIHLYAYSEVVDVSGFVGNFKVKVKRKATYVDWNKCTGCSECAKVCPVKVSSEYDVGVSQRKAIYIMFPQAVPNKATIDPEHCLRLVYGKGCGLCAKTCPAGAINFEQKEKIEEIDVGAIIVATGFDVMDPSVLTEYGGGKYKDVISALQFERILAPSGPTGGKVVRPSDGKEPKTVVFVQCAGSRDPEHYIPYCSKVCCMYTAKQALLYKHAVPNGHAYVFYIDVRTDGKGYEEFYERVLREAEATYLRGKVAEIYEEDGKLKVLGVDTLTGKGVEINADLVVLATAAVPSEGIKELAKILRIQTDDYGWLKEAHLKLRPLETATSGIFIAGAAQFIRDITDTVSHASGAAAKALSLLSRNRIEREPLVAEVNEEICSGCGNCVEACTYQAIKIDPETNIAKINTALCEGCGACQASCPSAAIQLTNSYKKQLFEMISILAKE